MFQAMLLFVLCLIVGPGSSFVSATGDDSSEKTSALTGYDLPLLPTSLPEHHTPNDGYNKHVPRHVWIAVKDSKDPLSPHIDRFFERNSLWERHVCDNACKDDFMNTTFAGTSVAWAYSMVSMSYAASKADIWRYAVLYTYGGVYLDDDSDIRMPLDEIVQSEDRLLLSEEGASSMGECYNPTYHLSDTSTYFLYANYTQATHYTGMSNEHPPNPQFFHGNTLVNWAMFTAPRHPIYAKILTSVVEIIKSMYLRESVLHLTRWDVKFKPIFCCTNFVLTYSVREMELENVVDKKWLPKISVNNFQEYGGNVKAYSTQFDPNHYRKALKHHAPAFLREMMPLDMQKYTAHLEGKTVMGDGGKEIFLIANGTKRNFPDYETFLNMKFTDKYTKHVSDAILNKIPLGPRISRTEPIVSVDSRDRVHATLRAHSQHPHHHHHTQQQRPSHPRNRHRGSLLTLELNDNSNSTTKETKLLRSIFGSTAHAEIMDESYRVSELFLTTARDEIDKKPMECWGDDYGGTRDDLLKDQWKSVVKDTPVMVYPLCTGMFQLGNTLGYYLNDIACADLTGAHFVAVHKTFKMTQPELLVAKDNATQLSFFHNLPDVIVHPQVKELNDVKKEMKKTCHCLQFCWENNDAPWLKRVPLIGKVLRPAIDAYVKAVDGYAQGTLLNPSTDRSTLPISEETFLPLVPNVTIQYRCGDNIGFGKTKYGLLPYSTYTSPRVPEELTNPPDGSKSYIYIIADSPNRSAAHVYSGRCEMILQKLFEYLQKKHPKAVIVLKRGGDLFLDYARIVYANVAVCSASTFCLWPALSNEVGQAHFPLTPLIAKADSNLTAPSLKDNFHWIMDKEMVKQFRHYRPWHRVIDDLSSM